MRVWDTKTGKQLTVFDGHRGQVNAVVFSPDSKIVVSGGRDETMRFWNMDVSSPGLPSRETQHRAQPTAASDTGDAGKTSPKATPSSPAPAAPFVPKADAEPVRPMAHFRFDGDTKNDGIGEAKLAAQLDHHLRVIEPAAELTQGDRKTH